jgi:hypothetical protein
VSRRSLRQRAPAVSAVRPLPAGAP